MLVWGMKCFYDSFVNGDEMHAGKSRNQRKVFFTFITVLPSSTLHIKPQDMCRLTNGFGQ